MSFALAADGFSFDATKYNRQMNLQAPVATIMTQNPYTLELSHDLRAAKKLMLRHKIRHLPVVADGQIVGIVSKTDLNRLTFGTTYADSDEADAAVFDMLTIGQVMAGKVQAVQMNDSIKAVAEIFASKEFHALPVLDGNTLVGIITTTDLIRFMLTA